MHFVSLLRPEEEEEAEEAARDWSPFRSVESWSSSLRPLSSRFLKFIRMILNWKKRSWSPNSRLIALVVPENEPMDSNFIQKWRPISNLQERDPQLRLHILQGTFDGSTHEISRPARRERSFCSSWEMDCPVRAKLSRDLVRRSRATVWSKLSSDLVLSVLLRLPSKSQFRFHAVCREWRENLSSSKFAEENAALKASAAGPDVICAYEYLGPNREEPDVYGPQDYIPEGAVELADKLHDAFTKSHRRKINGMDLSFAPSWIIGNRMTACRDGLLLSYSKTRWRCSGPASAHGGMCLINPFTRTFRELPPVPFADGELLWTDHVMVERMSPSHYRAVVLMGAGDGNQWSVYQFSSKTNEWTSTAGNVPKELPLDAIGRKFRYLSQSYMFTEDLLYLWRGNVNGDLLIHSLKDGSLLSMSRVGYPELPSDTMDWRFLKVHLVEHRGAIYGGWLLSGWRPRPGCLFGISKLDMETMKWGELVVLPQETLQCSLGFLELAKTGMDYRPHDWKFYEHKAVVVVGDYICISITSDHVNKGVNLQYVGGFHIPSKSWQSFDFHDPYVSGTHEFELFEPNCLHVHL